ncbi:hypothetical protein D0869_05909 [Hortaea werneckii]|uniref:Invertebrate defensins family profile domain-containing protein n=1 Tax=Hortaea werneckii TaxID=91943 RepID=A0A3M6WWD7_HORWE|nr:hypothetical protein KC334_g373 [Hortaea werneckii]KAI7026376.1 hypothetical protein KC355_g674 [Hortaea werneckii]KAI7205181.1 hypothetical protein KC324_g437 [Hortaea werneckii]KAI7595630.1 hypothetical protein KC316_g401 [Hortaea werneckii]KAI7676279.1 hypothetical protein KC318_g370 [Hortaea werneckii]
MKLTTASSIFAWAVAGLAKAEDSWYIGGDHNVTCVRDPGGQLDCETGFKEGTMKVDLASLGPDYLDEAAQTDASLEKRGWKCKLAGLGCSTRCYAGGFCIASCEEGKCHCSCRDVPVAVPLERCVKMDCSGG